MQTVQSPAIHVASLADWRGSAYATVGQGQVTITGPAMASGPEASPAEPLPSRAAIVVIDLLTPVRNVAAAGVDNADRHIVTTLHSAEPLSRLTLRLDDASRLRSVTLFKTVPGRVDLTISGAEVWMLGPDHAAASILRPSALVADARWETRAYGLPQGDDELVRWLAWSAIDAPTPVPWWAGTRIVLHPGETLSRAIAQSGTYEPGTAVMLKRLLPRDAVFVDAGANSGVFTVPASRWVGRGGRVVAVEPSPREVAKLRANLALNDAANVTVVEEALGSMVARGRLLIGSARDAGLNTLGPALAHGATAGGTCEVAVTTLDELCRTLELDRLDLVKADIEGGEHDLLLGGTASLARFRPALVMEVEVSALDAGGHDIGELETMLEGLDYRCFALNGDGPPRFLDSLAGFDRGNILAVPTERSEDLLRESAEAQASVRQDRLIERLTALSAEAYVDQGQIRETFQRQAAAAEAEAERLRGELQQLRATSDAQHAAAKGFAIERAALETNLQERAGALDEAHHAVHQLESRTRQQRSALDDAEHELTLARATIVAGEAALAAERAATSELTSSLAALTVGHEDAEAKLAAAEVGLERATAEYGAVIAQLEARAAAVDARMAATLKTMNRRHLAMVTELEADGRQALNDAEQYRQAAQAEINSLGRRADGLEGEAALLRGSLQAASDEAHYRARELAESRARAEHLDRELHERERHLQAARDDPVGFLVKRLGYYRHKRTLVGLLTGSSGKNR